MNTLFYITLGNFSRFHGYSGLNRQGMVEMTFCDLKVREREFGRLLPGRFHLSADLLPQRHAKKLFLVINQHLVLKKLFFDRLSDNYSWKKHFLIDSSRTGLGKNIFSTNLSATGREKNFFWPTYRQLITRKTFF
jgi:hypothetical protein